MKLGNRALLRAGAAAVGLVTAASFAAPALAGATDVAVDITGTTIAADSSGKFGSITVKNLGSTTPEEILVVFDLSAVDDTKVDVETCEGGHEEDGKVFCVVPTELIPAPGGAADLIVPLSRKDGNSGPAGNLKITVAAEGEDASTLADNSKTVALTLGEHSGVDLRVEAPDVRNSLNDDGALVDELVTPGGNSVVFGFFANQGDMVANGVRVTVSLPEGATYSEAEDGCEYSADNRVVTCDYEEIVLIPADKDANEDDDVVSSAAAFFPLTVASSVATGAVLEDGAFKVEAMDVVEYGDPTLKRAPRTEVPDNVEMGGHKDVDESDNVDEFAVFVGGGGGGGGPLPVTGPAAYGIAGGGAAVLALGLVLFFAARRRRIVTQA